MERIFGWKSDAYPASKHVAAAPCEYVVPEDLTVLDRLVQQIATRYGADPGAIADSEQYADGWVGLVMARDRYDPSRGMKFKTFAGKRIESEILSGFRRRDGKVGSAKRSACLRSLAAYAGPDEVVADHRPAPPARHEPARVAFTPRRRALVAALRALHPRTRRIVVRTVMGNMSQEAAGRDEGLGPGRANAFVKSGLAQLRKRMSAPA